MERLLVKRFLTFAGANIRTNREMAKLRRHYLMEADRNGAKSRFSHIIFTHARGCPPTVQVMGASWRVILLCVCAPTYGGAPYGRSAAGYTS